MRDWIDLVEKRLPLQPGRLDVARGSYGSLIVVMHPEDFLRLTTKDETEYQKIFQDEFSDLADYKSGAGKYNKTDYHMPFLRVEYPSGKVVGHEGRHRAAMIIRAGGDKFPVMLFFREPAANVVSYVKVDNETDEHEEMERSFSSYQEAEAFVKELEAVNKDWNAPVYYRRIKNDVRGMYPLKGHPGRSDFSQWEYAAWKPEDMPEHLVGQFNPSVIVPSSRMKAGVVKGYTHYKR